MELSTLVLVTMLLVSGSGRWAVEGCDGYQDVCKCTLSSWGKPAADPTSTASPFYAMAVSSCPNSPTYMVAVCNIVTSQIDDWHA